MIGIGRIAPTVLAALAFVAALGFASAEAAEFKVRGTDIASGKAYEGRVSATIAGNAVKVVWDVQGEHYTGNGVFDGDALAVYFTGPTVGVALYHFDRATGIFRGKWTTAGSNKVGTEDWFPVQ